MENHTLYILLFSVDDFDRNYIEGFENAKFDDFSQMWETMRIDLTETEQLIYTLTEFIDEANDQEIDLENYWITNVWIKK